MARKVLFAVAALLLLAGGWWIASPWWTLWRMRDAAEAGDARALAAYIDFPALRASTKRQLPGPLGRLARPAIDLLVTPAGLRLALTKRVDPGEGELELDREGLSEFRLRHDGKPDLVFRRHGLRWRLSEVRLARGA
ncbi:MAG: DUF2939 domain-containing protein [Allosphingosinicella sp.]